MTRYLTKRVKGFLTAQFPAHVLILIFVWVVSHIKIWVAIFVTYLVVIFAGFIYEIFRAWRFKQQRKYAKQTRLMVLLLRKLIDLACTYENDPEKFQRKFLEAISISALRESGIIDPSALLQIPPHKKAYSKMKRADAELWALRMAGLSMRELKIIYGLKNMNSMYVKLHRMKSRLDKNTQELLENRG